MAPEAARIAMPVQGTIIALDPDIPPQAQRLRLKASDDAGARVAWRMDGKALGRGPLLDNGLARARHALGHDRCAGAGAGHRAL